MLVGYARVSTEDQNLDGQHDALARAGCTKIYEEKKSGACCARPVLDSALARLRTGDMLVVWKLDRLGRSLKHLLAILERLEKRGIGFRSLSDCIDTTTPAGKLLFHITGAVAEFERSLVSERTKAGMLAARRKGSRLGRPSALDAGDTSKVLHMAMVDDIPLPAIAAHMKVSESTVRRAIANFRAQVGASPIPHSSNKVP